MKIATLRRVFERTRHTKLFVDAGKYAVAGYATRPRAPDEELARLELRPSVAYFHAAGHLVRCSEPFGPVPLEGGTRITRRLRTHRRHLEGRGVPEEYFEAAADL